MPSEGTRSGLHDRRMCELCIFITACLAACRPPDGVLLTSPCSTANALPDTWADTASQRRPLSLRNAARDAPCAQAPRRTSRCACETTVSCPIQPIISRTHLTTVHVVLYHMVRRAYSILSRIRDAVHTPACVTCYILHTLYSIWCTGHFLVPSNILHTQRVTSFTS